MKIGVVVFPASNCEKESFQAIKHLGHQASWLSHTHTRVHQTDALILPGGFSYGDYLRSGAIAAVAPIMKAIRCFVQSGGRVLGICNGFQILCEAGLLEGTLIRNSSLRFCCKVVSCQLKGMEKNLKLPIAHMNGNYQASPPTLEKLEAEQRILLRYRHNINGSAANIAGIHDKTGRVWGMMPHPERALYPFHPSRDGATIFKHFLAS